ncbi:hypothetical protein ABT116_38960 [Streptomyces sp. NPDC002130]|uniref:hypothetical protein n=1 Tax=Streptomyces sp. NPDC002130 TaxID=3155568 RepID=UPI00332AC3C1
MVAEPDTLAFGTGSGAGRSGRAQSSAQVGQPGAVSGFGQTLTHGQKRKEPHRAGRCGRSLQFVVAVEQEVRQTPVSVVVRRQAGGRFADGLPDLIITDRPYGTSWLGTTGYWAYIWPVGPTMRLTLGLSMAGTVAEQIPAPCDGALHP